MKISKAWTEIGQPFHIRVTDNGGKTADRFTVYFVGARVKREAHMDNQLTYLGMSSHPTWPQGICQHGFTNSVCATNLLARLRWDHILVDKINEAQGDRDIAFSSLPEDCQRAALADYRCFWPEGAPARPLVVQTN
jgi:hypothetical protein